MVLEKILESPLDCKEIQPVSLKGNQSWIFIGRTDAKAETPLKKDFTLATWCEELTHWKRTWCWERLKARGEGDDRGWKCWMASLTRWTWVWASSGSWWWTGRPGVLQSIGLQRAGHDWVTELNCTELRMNGCRQCAICQGCVCGAPSYESVPSYHNQCFQSSLMGLGSSSFEHSVHNFWSAQALDIYIPVRGITRFESRHSFKCARICQCSDGAMLCLCPPQQCTVVSVVPCL